MTSNVKTVIRIPLAFTTALLLACAGASTAGANEEVRSETVKFQDLNVDSPAGVGTLYSRIHAAAKRVCAESDPLRRMATASCARQAEARAIAKVGLPQLTALYQSKTGDKTEPLIANR